MTRANTRKNSLCRLTAQAAASARPPMVMGSLLLGLAAGGARADPVGHDCVLWLRADQGVTVNGASQVVMAVDQSGLGHDATNSTGDGPLLLAGAVGGRPAMRFAGAQWLSLAGQVLTSQRYTILAVVNDTRTEGSFHEVFSNWTFGNSGTSVFLGTTAIDPAGPGTTRARLTDDVGGANQGQTGVGVITARANHFILTGVSGAANASVYQNRTLIASSAQPISPRNLSGPYVIGRQGPIAEFWTGDIAEVLVYNAVLSACEIEAVTDYLSGRFGLAPCLPAITQQPTPITLCDGSVGTLTVAVSGGSCSDNVAYQWTRNNVPVTNGSVYAGSQRSVLSVRGVGGAVEGDYRCIITTSCGSVTSNPATLAITTCACNLADITGVGGPPALPDGLLTGDDFNAFIAAFANGEMLADIVGIGGEPPPDGLVTGDDFNAFIAAFANGCP